VTQNVGQATSDSDIAIGLPDDLLNSRTINRGLMPNDLQQTWDITFPGMDDALFNNHDQMLDLAEQFQAGDLDPSILFGPI
jgi:hypothetical protein